MLVLVAAWAVTLAAAFAFDNWGGYGHDGDNDCGDCQNPRVNLADGLHVFGKGKAQYWIGPRFAGYFANGAGADPGDLDPNTNRRGEPSANVVYEAEAAMGDTQLSIRTFGRLHPPRPCEYPPIATVQTATGQLVVMCGHAPPPDVLARMLEEIRPIMEADVSRMPDSWFSVHYPPK